MPPLLSISQTQLFVISLYQYAECYYLCSEIPMFSSKIFLLLIDYRSALHHVRDITPGVRLLWPLLTSDRSLMQFLTSALPVPYRLIALFARFRTAIFRSAWSCSASLRWTLSQYRYETVLSVRSPRTLFGTPLRGIRM